MYINCCLIVIMLYYCIFSLLCVVRSCIIYDYTIKLFIYLFDIIPLLALKIVYYTGSSQQLTPKLYRNFHGLTFCL